MVPVSGRPPVCQSEIRDLQSRREESETLRIHGSEGQHHVHPVVERHQKHHLRCRSSATVIRPYALRGSRSTPEEGGLRSTIRRSKRSAKAARFVRGFGRSSRPSAVVVDGGDPSAGSIWTCSPVERGADVFTLADARTPWTYAQSPNPTWVDWRPELSQWGSHLYGNLNWNLSDTFSVGGSAKYLVDTLTGVTIRSDGSQEREDFDGLMTGSSASRSITRRRSAPISNIDTSRRSDGTAAGRPRLQTWKTLSHRLHTAVRPAGTRCVRSRARSSNVQRLRSSIRGGLRRDSGFTLGEPALRTSRQRWMNRRPGVAPDDSLQQTDHSKRSRGADAPSSSYPLEVSNDPVSFEQNRMQKIGLDHVLERRRVVAHRGRDRPSPTGPPP